MSLVADAIEQVANEINAMLNAFDKDSKYMNMLSDLTDAEIYWLFNYYYMIQYWRERQLMSDEAILRHLNRIKDFLWLRANRNRGSRGEFKDMFLGIKEDIKEMFGKAKKGGLRFWGNREPQSSSS